MDGNVEAIIDKKIDDIVKNNNIYHTGRVTKVNEYIIEASGLEDCFYFEKVYIGESQSVGFVDKIEENKIIVSIVKVNDRIRVGDSIINSGEVLTTYFSESSLGMVIDPFGADKMTGRIFNNSTNIAIETPAIPLMKRTSVNRPLETGIMSIDLMFPIGKGQRQLIIGDKKTGKTQILLDTIVNQKNKNVICVYVAIGKTKNEIKRMYSKLVEYGANQYTVIVAAFNDDPTPLVKLTPYVGVSIAEEFMKKGYDVLVCIDDLKKHADACREIALMSGKNSGREAYPADIFYSHSRLLEKGGQYDNGASITILPIVETRGGDITDYISTNIISITDGQIVLSDKLFAKGQKPAINFGLSVSRLGSAVQNPAIRKTGSVVRQELLSYLETADVYQLVNPNAMSPELREKTLQGKKLLDTFKQPKFSPVDSEKFNTIFDFIINKPETKVDEEVDIDEVGPNVKEQPAPEVQTPAPEPAPVVETPVVETPVAEAPVAEVPVTEAPAPEAPIAEAPVVEAHVQTEIPTVEEIVPQVDPTEPPPPIVFPSFVKEETTQNDNQV